ncbi:hypothetical protein CV014_19855 [Nostoc sp. CMAA1605]|nr:hypothetical protein [Nostoc sp. CMAA1605]
MDVDSTILLGVGNKGVNNSKFKIPYGKAYAYKIQNFLWEAKATKFKIRHSCSRGFKTQLN